MTIETCHHYLSLAAEDVPDSHVEYKCCPPVRDQANQRRLWQAILDGDIDMVVSDHSPSTPDMKLLTDGPDQGDFVKAWGGISSVQFGMTNAMSLHVAYIEYIISYPPFLGLSLFWTKCHEYGLDITDMHRLMCAEPAKLCGLQHVKGKIAKGFDADFCVWNPDAEFVVTTDIVQFQNKVNPYLGKQLKGQVYATFVRGNRVFCNGRTDRPVGTLLKASTPKLNRQ